MPSAQPLAATIMLTVLLGLSLPASAQWTRSGTITYLANPADQVGVGISSPLVKFDVRGGHAMFGPVSGSPGVVTVRPSGFGAWWNLANTQNGQKFIIASGDKRAANDNTSWTSSPFTIQLDGKVGIGTLNPQSALAVNGTVTAKALVVTNTGWADYVFKPGYRLEPLSAVETFIEREGHLPGIPVAARIEENGLDVGAMQVKLLEKIEELTLHVIRQEKRIAALAASNAELSARLSAGAAEDGAAP